MKFFFRHKQAEAEQRTPVPDSHKRVASVADKFNEALMRFDEARERTLNEIADKQEELRQLDQCIAAMRAGLTTIVDDPSLAAITQNVARNHLDATMLNHLDEELKLDAYDVS